MENLFDEFKKQWGRGVHDQVPGAMSVNNEADGAHL